MHQELLMVFVKYVYNGAFQEKSLCCSSHETNTKAADIVKIVSTLFQSEHLQYKNLSSCCTDGVLAMLGCKFGFEASVKQQALASKGVHCMLHRQALICNCLIHIKKFWNK